MRMRFFAVPALTPGPAADELESFLAGHRVLAIDRQFVSDGPASYWAICVTHQQGASSSPKVSKRSRVDYRELLSEQDFAVFARLRELRKSLSQREAVPAYAIFTNEQLAAIATQRPATAGALASISGIGAARVDKYGELVLELLQGAGPKPDAGQEQTDAPA